MTKRMLIDATHAEETRVVVLDGNRLEDFDTETSTKKQIKGNIYLAKIVRVEPSLQAAFVEYGGGRHGFLAFGEIHPDYYQIPVADRQRLLAAQEEEAREAEAAEDAAAASEDASGTAAPAADMAEPAEVDAADTPVSEPPGTDWPGADTPDAASDSVAEVVVTGLDDDDADGAGDAPAAPAMALAMHADHVTGGAYETDPQTGDLVPDVLSLPLTPIAELVELGLTIEADGRITGDDQAMAQLADALDGSGDPAGPGEDDGTDATPAAPPPETLNDTGADADQAEERERRVSSRALRNYKIQEVIRRRQIMLVQVVKEERGGKGAALTTYISLAGRFCVLMPNSPRGGGISRKITSAADRRRLKEITTELAIPSGMGLIVRTAGAARPKPEIKRDCEYLLQLWDDIRDTTMASVAPAAIYEEASLIKRVIRDVYSRDVDEVWVDGREAWSAARDQMRLLMPSHANRVQLWNESQPLFAHHQVDAQLDAMLSPTVQLKSGGYLVINQTEALVAIDVNSGRSTRERGIEETALRTNSEAAEEVARQLRLRDLAGLIVIDFIDMEQRRNNATVERKLKDALKNDRARIQLGSISHFGLMEMSRQRLRPSLAETSFVQCSHCSGTGLVRSTEGAAISVLRAIEEEGGKRKSAEIMLHVAGTIAMYILNHKRERLQEIEERYGMTVLFAPDDTLLPPAVKIDRLRAYAAGEAPPITQRAAIAPPAAADEIEDEAAGFEEDAAETPAQPDAVADAAPAPGGVAEGDGTRRKRRRRRRRGGRREDGQAATSGVAGTDEDGDEDGEDEETGEAAGSGEAFAAPEATDDPALTASEASEAAASPDDQAGGDTAEESGVRRRGRRGGRRRRKDGGDGAANTADRAGPIEANAAPMPAYTGPTPANPFGGGTFDIFDAIEQALAAPMEHAPTPVAAPAPLPEPEPEPEPELELAVTAEPAPVAPAADPDDAPAADAPAAAAASAADVPEPAPDPAEIEPVLPLDVPVLAKRVRAPRRKAVAVAQPSLPDGDAPDPVAPPAKPARSRAAAKPAAAAVPAEPDAPPAPAAATPEPATPEPAAPEPAAPAEAAPAAPKRGWWRK